MPPRDELHIALLWAVWLGVLIATVAIGLGVGAYEWSPGWVVHHGLWPLFVWDYNWYWGIAHYGYTSFQNLQQYAFFPLWPLILRRVGTEWDYAVALSLAWAASAGAFFGLARGLPRAGFRSAAALACWPGSFALTIAYPDGVALAAGAWAAAFVLRGRPLAAGALGAVAAGARPNGVLIALPLAWLARGKGIRGWLGAALPVAATAAVEAYFWSRSGRALVFFDAQRQWGRGGPRNVPHWLDHTARLLSNHGAVVGVFALAAVAALVVVWRRFGPWTAVVAGYACAVAFLLAATRSLEGFVDSARAAIVLPLLVVLWRLGDRYRPWAAFATLVVVSLLLSGTMQSFGRQSLFAFPIFWAVADGPRWLRSPFLAVAGFAGNVVLVLLLTRFAP